MTDTEVELREHWLGLRPYVLLQLKAGNDDSDGEIRADLDYGGGLKTEDLRPLLEMMLESLPGAAPEQARELPAGASRWRKRPVVVDAIRWTGDNEAEVFAFCRDERNDFCFSVLAEDKRSYDFTAEVFDRLHGTWIPLRTGDWVIRGVKRELYPCEAEVFEATYEPQAVAAPVVVSWDCRQQPDLHELADTIRVLSGGRVHLHDVGDTGGQDYAVVLATEELTDAQVRAAWERHWRGEEAPVNDIEATGDCCCGGCIGTGPCGLELGRADEDDPDDEHDGDDDE